MSERREHPVVWGLVALVTVSAVLGLLVGVGALAASRMAGLGGGSGAASAGAGDSLYLPTPSDTAEPSSSGSGSASDKPRKNRTKSAEPETSITLTAGQTSVSPMGQIDLSGRYPGGDGAILQVQRLDAGQWVDFPVQTSVSGDTFATYVQTGRPGPNKFRMRDSDSGDVSNEVKVTIG